MLLVFVESVGVVTFVRVFVTNLSAVSFTGNPQFSFLVINRTSSTNDSQREKTRFSSFLFFTLHKQSYETNMFSRNNTRRGLRVCVFSSLLSVSSVPKKRAAVNGGTV